MRHMTTIMTGSDCQYPAHPEETGQKEKMAVNLNGQKAWFVGNKEMVGPGRFARQILEMLNKVWATC